MNRFWIIGCVVLVVTGCAHSEKKSHEQAPLSVSTMVVETQFESATSRYVGTIEPSRETPLSMQTTGRVVAVYAKNGDRVHKGQLLLETDNTQARNALEAAEASLKHAEDGYTRAQQVHAKGAITDQQMVEIDSKLAQARSMYAAAQQQLNECSLTAPCEGVIDELHIENGQSVVPGVKVCTILDVSAFCVRFTVPEGEIKTFRTKKALKGEVSCAAVDSVFPITITETGITANPVSHTYDVVARIQGGSDVLMTGMVGKVRVNREGTVANHKEGGVIVIPARCVLLQKQGHTVWLMQNGTAVRRDIQIDGYQAEGVRVVSGLNSGDTLIIDGYKKLYNGCTVKSE